MRAWGVGFIVNGLVMLYLLSRLSLRHRRGHELFVVYLSSNDTIKLLCIDY